MKNELSRLKSRLQHNAHGLAEVITEKIDKQKAIETNDSSSALFHVRLELINLIAEGLVASKKELNNDIREWADKAGMLAVQEDRSLSEALSSLSLFRKVICKEAEKEIKDNNLSYGLAFKITDMICDLIDITTIAYSEQYINYYSEELEKATIQIQEDQQLIKDLSAPIIPSIVPNTILIPLTGQLNAERIEQIREKVVNNIKAYNADTAIIDFTGIHLKDQEDFSLVEIARQIDLITTSLGLMGVETIYVGFSTHLAQEIVGSGVQIKAKTFSNFRLGLQYLSAKKGYKLTSI
ncbi:STAS domain-containing protein [Thalassobacillus sp. C254]|uniref:STAS domain-containing protein n=1 Tax=Thalassobacillus sp. C254 TaxID=1225341 RepID=UPI0009F84FC6|nr:STAS domain-containing protein [Thalassobacillus sp. C254]